MFFFSLFLKERDPKFEEGEYLIHRAKRHWMILLYRLIIPTIILLACLFIIFFRLSGGVFLANTGPSAGFDLMSLIIVGVIISLVVAFLRSRIRFPKDRTSRRNMIVAGFLLLVYLFYHLSGGRLISFAGPSSGMDSFNVVLSLVVIFTLLAMDYMAFDWRSDDLLLTNMRVIYEDYVPLVKDFRLQTQVEQVQSVVAKSDTYLQNLLGYGTVIVQSAGQTKIIFDGCDDFDATNDPVTGLRKRVSKLQTMLQKELNKVNQERSPREYRTMVSKQVFGNAPPPAIPPVSVPQRGRGLWFLPENPLIKNDSGRTIIWHKFWIFELRSLLAPVTIGVLLFTILIVAERTELIELWAVFALGLIALLVTMAWSWYEIEDHRNDLYILTTSNIIDIEKKPFGPENRRQAGLGQIQNVTYNTTFFGNLLGYGDVFVETASQSGKFTFTRVPNPREVATTINDYLNAFRQGDKERTLRDSLLLLKAYHDEQNARSQQP